MKLGGEYNSTPNTPDIEKTEQPESKHTGTQGIKLVWSIKGRGMCLCFGNF